MRQPGLHLIADLEECDLGAFVCEPGDVAELKDAVSAWICEAGFTELGNFYHFFGPGAVTGVVCLAESHLSFHTWPELGRTSIDLYVCNNLADHSAAARTLFDRMCGRLFKPGRIRKSELSR